jgi:hypothetical protein
VLHESFQAVRPGNGIIIQENHYLAPGCRNSGVARA